MKTPTGRFARLFYLSTVCGMCFCENANAQSKDAAEVYKTKESEYKRVLDKANDLNASVADRNRAKEEAGEILRYLQELEKPQLANSANSTSKAEDIRTLVSLTANQQILLDTLSASVEHWKTVFPQVSAKDWEILKEALSTNAPAVYYTIYNQHFTHDEIKDLVRFYQSPTGRKALTESPAMMREASMAGAELEKELEKRVRAEYPTAKTIPPKPTTERHGRLTKSEREQYLRLQGLDPSTHELVDLPNDQLSIQPRAIAPTQPFQNSAHTKTNALPSSVKFMIRWGENTAVSEAEPQIWGNGYKFRCWPRGNEITISGNVEIFKLGSQ
jgi:uncharacterized protein